MGAGHPEPRSRTPARMDPATPVEGRWTVPGEARRWIAALRKLPGAEAPTPAPAVALLTAAAAEWRLGDHVAALALYREADPLARQLGDAWILFVALADQAMEAQQRGDYAAARAYWEEGLIVTRASGDQVSEAILLNNIGRTAIYQCDYAAGRERCERALSLARSLGDVWVMSMGADLP